MQRVGFRRFAEKTARASDVTGYVQNVKDGTVVIFAQGEQENIGRFIENIKSAKDPIIVDHIEVKKAQPRPKLKYFEIRPSGVASEIQEGFGAIESQFSDYRSEFRSFAEKTDENFQSMERKYGGDFWKVDRDTHRASDGERGSDPVFEQERRYARQSR